MPFRVRKFDAKVMDPNAGQMVDIGLLGSSTMGDIDAAKNAAVAVVTANANVQVNRIVETGTASITDMASIYVLRDSVRRADRIIGQAQPTNTAMHGYKLRSFGSIIHIQGGLICLLQ